jgi:F420-dependent oxidoreductase-like protein
VRIGLALPDFSWASSPLTLGPDLGRIARLADEGGFSSITVMDHFFQIGHNGPPDDPMLEGYSLLAFLAGQTSRIQLGTLVTGVHYRHPGLLGKIVTTLDVLSGGRAWLGIGAGWNEEESRGLGVPFPTTAQRFEQLEETLQIVTQMWRGDESPYQGKHFQLDRPLNSPQSIRRPHPPIMIGGSGERKTLRLVARYADACNIFPGPELPRKLEILRAHCEAEGRAYDEIEKTTIFRFDPGERGERIDETLDGLRELASQGIQTVYGTVKDAHTLRPLELMAERVIPAAAAL